MIGLMNLSIMICGGEVGGEHRVFFGNVEGSCMSHCEVPLRAGDVDDSKECLNTVDPFSSVIGLDERILIESLSVYYRRLSLVRKSVEIRLIVPTF